MKIKNLLVVIFFLNIECSAQKIFKEGKIVYNVFLSQTLKDTQGTLTVIVKNGQMKRVLQMRNGINNTIVSNKLNNNSISYNEKNGNKFAKKITQDEQLIKNIRFKNAKYEYSDNIKIIAGLQTKKVLVTYTNYTTNEVYYTKEILPELQDFNALFPELIGMPLYYQVSTNSGEKIYFLATSIEDVPIYSDEFLPLKGYKLVD